MARETKLHVFCRLTEPPTPEMLAELEEAGLTWHGRAGTILTGIIERNRLIDIQGLDFVLGVEPARTEHPADA